MIISKEVNVKLSNSTLQYYLRKGYKVGKQGEIISVKVEDLPEKSAVNIIAKCDICGIEKECRFYNYKHTTKNGDSRYLCINCKLRENAENSIFNNNFSFDNVAFEFKLKKYELISNESDYENKNSVLSFRCGEHPEDIQYTTYKRMKESESQCKYCKKSNVESNKGLFLSIEDINNFLVMNNRKYIAREIDNSNSIIELECTVCKCKISIKSTSIKKYTKQECLHQHGMIVNKTDEIKKCQEEIDKRENNITIQDLYYVNNSKLYASCICKKHKKIFEGAFDKMVKPTYLGCKECISEDKRGKNNHNWNSSLTDSEREKLRTTDENSHLLWRKMLFEKYNYTCAVTNKNGSLNGHHLNSYHWDVENRFNINNGICILKSIHKLFHKLYGTKNNTKEQFEEFKIRYNIGEFGFDFK